MEKTISNEEYLQLLGLAVLAKGHKTTIDSICASMQKIVGDEYDGHICDFVYGECYPNVHNLLKCLNIVVEEVL